MSFLYVVGRIYFTMIPLILGGIANMIFTKTELYKKNNKPIDCGKTLNGKRIFGDNKTYIGFISMMFFCTVFQILFGVFCNVLNLNQHNDLYNIRENTFTLNLIFGLLTGFVYMISELPNSFIKRQLDIKPGKTASGIKGVLFFLIDQIDSLIGVMFLLFLFSDFSIIRYFLYLLLGAITHIIINLILYTVKIRKNI